MDAFDPAAYGPVFSALLRDAPQCPLDAGRPDPARRPMLAAVSDDAFLPRRVVNRDMAAACRAGLWLHFDFLDESHAISQEDEGAPDRDFWHAIMHRREPDYDNAKYWFRRVGQYPIYEMLHAAARELTSQSPLATDKATAFLRTQSSWDPYRFVDLCAAVAAGRSKSERLCQEIQRREWELLFDFCYRQTV